MTLKQWIIKTYRSDMGAMGDLAKDLARDSNAPSHYRSLKEYVDKDDVIDTLDKAHKLYKERNYAD